MRLLSSTSTSSAQVEGQSCGQAEAPILGPCGRGRTVWFMVRAPYSISAQSDILRRRRHFSSNSNLWKNLQNKYHSMLRRVSHLSWLPVHCLTATCPHQITSFDCLVGTNREWHTTFERLGDPEVHDHLKFCRKL